jgi:hypothetical protein
LAASLAFNAQRQWGIIIIIIIVFGFVAYVVVAQVDEILDVENAALEMLQLRKIVALGMLTTPGNFVGEK